MNDMAGLKVHRYVIHNVYQILYLPDTNLGEGVPKKVASVVSVKMFLAPFAMAAKKAAPVALVYIRFSN